jgi:hypothetical protein
VRYFVSNRSPRLLLDPQPSCKRGVGERRRALVVAQRISRPLRRYGVAVGVLYAFALPAWGSSELLYFDIPVQPLEAALYLYGDVSRQPALFPSALIAGLSSSAVHGRYPAETALRLLLGGTGLIAEKMGSAHGDVFLLKRAANATADAGAAEAEGAQTADQELNGYPALIQARVIKALCANPRTAPGAYRSLFSIQVDSAGDIGNAHLIDSTGDSSRDAALLATLQRVQIGTPPPSVAMQQPFTMTLLPTSPDAESPCSKKAGAPPS